MLPIRNVTNTKMCTTFRICKKFANLQKLNFFLQNPVYNKNVCKKNCPKNDKLYIFEKPLTMPFQICKKVLQNFK